MSDVHTYSSDVAFTRGVKAIQARKGSREAYANVEARGGWRTEIDENLAAFLSTEYKVAALFAFELHFTDLLPIRRQHCAGNHAIHPGVITGKIFNFGADLPDTFIGQRQQPQHGVEHGTL